MKCPKCNHKNADGAKFCSNCATQLCQVCPSCNATNIPVEAKFCPECGNSFGDIHADVTFKASKTHIGLFQLNTVLLNWNCRNAKNIELSIYDNRELTKILKVGEMSMTGRKRLWLSDFKYLGCSPYRITLHYENFMGRQNEESILIQVDRWNETLKFILGCAILGVLIAAIIEGIHRIIEFYN